MGEAALFAAKEAVDVILTDYTAARLAAGFEGMSSAREAIEELLEVSPDWVELSLVVDEIERAETTLAEAVRGLGGDRDDKATDVADVALLRGWKRPWE